MSIPKNSATSKRKIDSIETTGDTLTSRCGLAPISRFVDSIGILDVLCGKFASLKKFKQVLCFMIDGTKNSITRFDELKKDEGYAAVIETAEKALVSRNQVERFFYKFNSGGFFSALRNILLDLFLWRLKAEKPSIVHIAIDTMVLDNDSAKKRVGATPTYKKVKGFQPLHMIWNGLIIDVIFRGGKKHGNHGNTVKYMIKRMVKRTRESLGSEVEIVFLFDSAFMDEEIFDTIRELGAHFIAAGKYYESVRKAVTGVPANEFKTLATTYSVWRWCEFRYKCKTWKRDVRAFYTLPLTDPTGQFVLDFGDDKHIILTSIEKDSHLEKIEPGISSGWSIIERDHSRGRSELAHRSIKDFAQETLPFKHFFPNAAFYHLRVIAYFILESFKIDVLADAVPGISRTSYPSTVRRVFIDNAARFVYTARRIVLKTTAAIMERMRLPEIWKRSTEAMPVCLSFLTVQSSVHPLEIRMAVVSGIPDFW